MHGPDPVERILICPSFGVLAEILIRTHYGSRGLRPYRIASVVDSEDD